MKNGSEQGICVFRLWQFLEVSPLAFLCWPYLCPLQRCMLLSPASIPLFTHLQWLCYLSFTTLSHWKFLLSSFLSVVLTDCLFYMQYLIWEAWSRCFSLDTWHLKSLFFLSATRLTSSVSSSLLSATLTSSVLSTNATSSNIVAFFKNIIELISAKGSLLEYSSFDDSPLTAAFGHLPISDS